MMSLSDSLVAGSVAGGVCRLLTAPLDVLKVRLQLQIEPISKVHLYIFHVLSISYSSHLLQNSFPSKYRSLSHAVKLILREEGFTAFW